MAEDRKIKEQMILTPNVLWEVQNVSTDTDQFTKVFSFFRISWKLQFKPKERHFEKSVVNLIVHRAPANYPRLSFTLLSWWKTDTLVDVFKKNEIRISLEELITEKKGNIEIWAYDLSDFLWNHKSFPGYKLSFICKIEIDGSLTDFKELNEEPFTSSCALSLSGDLKSLLDTSTMTDVTLKCGETRIPAHKCILSCRSPVFKEMFQDDFEESPQSMFDITDVEPTEFRKLIDYVYAGDIDTTSECVESICKLFRAAHKYCMESLKEKCACFLKENLMHFDACDILDMSHSSAHQSLKEFMVYYIASRKELLLSREWQKFAKEHMSLAQDVFLQYVRISDLK